MFLSAQLVSISLSGYAHCQTPPVAKRGAVRKDAESRTETSTTEKAVGSGTAIADDVLAPDASP